MKPSERQIDLRRRILDSSLALIDEEGVAALSMREVARRAGVSHGAPYHHFVDRAAILSALAEEGFVELSRALRDASESVVDPLDRFEQCGRAYFTFARTRSAYFRIMFRPELHDPVAHPGVDQAGAAAFGVLFEIVVACQAARVAPPGDPMAICLTTWATVHGISSLWVDGPLSRGALGMQMEADALARIIASTLRALLKAAAPGAP